MFSAASVEDVSAVLAALPTEQGANIKAACCESDQKHTADAQADNKGKASKGDAQSIQVILANGELVVELFDETDITVASLKERIAGIPNAIPKTRQRLVMDDTVLADSDVIKPDQQLLLVDMGNAPTAGSFLCSTMSKMGNGTFATLQLSDDGSVVGHYRYYDAGPPEGGYDTTVEFNVKGEWQYEDGSLRFNWATAKHTRFAGRDESVSEDDAKTMATSATWRAETDIIAWKGMELRRDVAPAGSFWYSEEDPREAYPAGTPVLATLQLSGDGSVVGHYRSGPPGGGYDATEEFNATGKWQYLCGTLSFTWATAKHHNLTSATWDATDIATSATWNAGRGIITWKYKRFRLELRQEGTQDD
mmetsp:Transcript_29733/g.81433  ORF Transcript_29733/g.81433 Transcript_29733/m.81433 type:complete len:363 (-) Transcript_29733:95-1183(-)|eukprot:CAMPEP_0117581578 /NCGR_PEP_ID=MMETSP0784-20121206/65911_1 /TAXON_ID=39447 /ORGANISM="" /LENGTH=362 /DNA_ID=CAMNT_0005381917 /DNA_START=82 /DNA_END=1170 /DNA_ORIENTATION=+